MDKLNYLIQELGISKVKLSKYLGVSRQMLYNYLDYQSFSDWPKEKRSKILELFRVNDISDLDTIVITDDLVIFINNKLNDVTDNSSTVDILDLKGLKKDNSEVLVNIFNLCKDMLSESDSYNQNKETMKYLLNLIQLIETRKDIRYLLAYFAKLESNVEPNLFIYNETEQYFFEGIIHTAFKLYSSGTASKQRVIQSRKIFLDDVEAKTEERLSRTEELNTTKLVALKELGYSEINEKNAKEVFDKMAEIQTRVNA